MPAIYYASDDGAATADAGRVDIGSFRTGAFGATSTYYAGAEAVFDGTPTTAPVPGDAVYLASDSLEDYAANTIVGITNGVTIYSVDVSNQENRLDGAIIQTTGGVFDLTLGSTATNTKFASHGVSYKAQDDLVICNAVGTLALITGGILQLTGTSGADSIKVSNNKDNCAVELKSTVIEMGNVDQDIFVSHANTISLKQCSGSGSYKNLFNNSSNGGCKINVQNSDFSNLTDAFSKLMAILHKCEITAHQLVLGAGISIDSATHTNKTSWIKSTSDSVGTANDNFFDLYQQFEWGTVVNDLTVHRDLGATYEGATEYSINLSSNANLIQGFALRYEFEGITAEPGATSSDLVIDGVEYSSTLTVKIHFAREGSTADFTVDEMMFNIFHADGANNAEGAMVTAGSFADTLPHQTAADHTTETGLWTIAATNAQMSISKTLTIGTSAGNIGPGVINFEAFLNRASEDVWVDALMDFS